MKVDSKIQQYINDSFVIAADAGVKNLEDLNIKPDLIVGDFDSLGFVPEGDNVIKYPVKKDDTDMMLAVKEALKLGYDDIVIFGGCGGRIDHTLANINTMIFALKEGAKITMFDSDAEYYICGTEIVLPFKQGFNFSIFAVEGMTKVCIENAMYNGEEITIANDTTLGVSNSFVDKDVKVTVREGIALIVVTNE
jgi:thiamine pyrophosphokinase